jgi:serine phosphatase RsbU (regulator of sigma subunit)
MSRQPIRILIVEDCLEDRELYKRFLNEDRHQQYVVFEADTGDRGFELLELEQPHCVLLDYLLPDRNGLEVLAQLADGHPSQDRPAVVMLTDHGSEELAVDALRSGAHDYLPKSDLSGEQLRGSIRRAVATVRHSRRRKRKDKELRRTLQDTKDQLKTAGEIQRLMLPTASPEVAGFDIAGACQPAEATGGDFFDFIPLPEGNLGLVMGDVVGHGLGAALFASETRAYLRAFSQTIAAPGEILTATNRLLCQDTRGERFVTLFFGCLDSRNRCVRFAAAGHRAYVLHGQGGAAKIDSHQPPLGLSPDLVRPTERDLLLLPGDLFVLMTDGITENAKPDDGRPLPDRMFSEAQALAFLQQNRCKPAAELVSSLIHEVSDFTGQPKHDDDMTVVIVRALQSARQR